MRPFAVLLLCATIEGGLFTDLNPVSAQTWTQTKAPTNTWTCIASSADGSKLVASGLRLTIPIYTSADGGGTWTLTIAPSNSWNSVASSADGNRLVAVQYGGGIFKSTNAGLTWISKAPPQ